MNTVTLKRGGKVTEISVKWRERFLKDGWVEEGAEPEKPKQVSTGDMAELIEASETKDDLEALIKDAFNVDLDKRKGLDKLKAESLELVNEG